MVGENIEKNTRTFNNSPLVIYLSQEDTKFFKDLNNQIFMTLEDFNNKNNTEYSLISDVMPHNFQPHITIANTASINNLISENRKLGIEIDRCLLVKKLNGIVQVMDQMFNTKLKMNGHYC